MSSDTDVMMLKEDQLMRIPLLRHVKPCTHVQHTGANTVGVGWGGGNKGRQMFLQELV